MDSNPAYRISVSDSQSSVVIDEALLQRVAEATLSSEEIVEAEISIALVDDPTIHEVNRNHLSHDYPTDVISFLLDSEPLEEPDPSGQRRGTGLRIDGDIIISGDTAAREAREYGWSEQSELLLYLVHGLLHLCGYDDLSDDEQIIMRGREREVLASFGLTPHYAED